MNQYFEIKKLCNSWKEVFVDGIEWTKKIIWNTAKIIIGE